MTPPPVDTDAAYERLCESFDSAYVGDAQICLDKLRDMRSDWRAECERIGVSDDHDQLDGAIRKLSEWPGVEK